jgi:hypothetical protein
LVATTHSITGRRGRFGHIEPGHEITTRFGGTLLSVKRLFLFLAFDELPITRVSSFDVALRYLLQCPAMV